MIDLKKLKSEHSECFSDSEKFKAYLKDLYPTEKARINILALMLLEGIVDVIGSDELTVKNFCNHISNEYGFMLKLVIECYNYFAFAFGSCPLAEVNDETNLRDISCQKQREGSEKTSATTIEASPDF